jgi:Na+/H+ antiporter NhaD/arsenite permease-like protein
MKKIKGFIKSEAVLLISAFAALLTMFFVPPSIDYISYIDFCTLALLFCFMTAVAGLKSIGFFDKHL